MKAIRALRCIEIIVLLFQAQNTKNVSAKLSRRIEIIADIRFRREMVRDPSLSITFIGPSTDRDFNVFDDGLEEVV